MLASYILRLRRAPKHIRERHAFFLATGVTALAAVLWATTSLPGTLSSGTATSTAETAGPVASFFGRAREQLATVWGSVANSTERSTEEQITTLSSTSAPITLTDDDLAKAQASSAVPYVPDAAPSTSTPTTSARVVRIVTTSEATTTATTSEPATR